MTYLLSQSDFVDWNASVLTSQGNGGDAQNLLVNLVLQVLSLLGRDAAGMNLLVVYLYSMTLKLLWTCNAQDLNCTVTRGIGQTNYSVPDFTAVGCEHSWSNGSNIVLANHEDENKELVKVGSDRTLVLRGCFETIHYMRSCYSEVVNLFVTREASCTTNCSEPLDPGPEEVLTEIGGSPWTVAGPFLFCTVLMVMLLFFCCKSRIHTCR
ncbi:uncharacterized protein V6R79_006213 [Siganus canaliculatus]